MSLIIRKWNKNFDGTQTLTLGQYYYDGDGKRIKKVESQQTTIYIYQGWNIIYEKESSTNTETKYIGGVAKIEKVNGTETITYFHVDHLGSTRAVTDSTGNLLVTLQYDPFGEVRSGLSNGVRYTFTGKEQDTTGLYYYGARFYDSKVGRFISKDLLAGSIGNPQTQNRYTYVLNNPLKYVDPTGNWVGAYRSFSCSGRSCGTVSGWVHGVWQSYNYTDNPTTPEQVLENYQWEFMQLNYDPSGAFIAGKGGQSVWTKEGIVEDNYIIMAFPNVLKGVAIMQHSLPLGSRGQRATTHRTQVNIGGKGCWAIDIYGRAYTNTDKYNVQAGLYHILGHELVHVSQYSSGEYDKLLMEGGNGYADAFAEIEAWTWNLENQSQFLCPNCSVP